MKNILNTYKEKMPGIIKWILIILPLTACQTIYAQCPLPKGAQSAAYGKPDEHAFFGTPAIHGNTTVCGTQTTTLSVNTGYSSYLWSNGNTTNTISVGPGTYTVTVSNALGCTRSNSITVISDPCVLTLNLTCYIQGYYAGGGFMSPVLMNEGIGTSTTITDSLEVELRNANAPYNSIASQKNILNTNGTGAFTFNASAGSYYIAIKHRNALYTWSATPRTFGATTVNYDFCTASSKAYGNNQGEVESGVWALYSGDFNFDDNIDLLDLGSLENDITLFAFGYFATDVNGDGNVDLLDSPVVEGNVNAFIFSIHP